MTEPVFETSSTPSEPLSRHIAAGLALALLVIVVMVMQALPRPEQPEDTQQTSPQLLLTGRYLVGCQAVIRDSVGANPQMLNQSFEIQLHVASDHNGRLCEAILLCELVGQSQGLAHLDKLIAETGDEALRDDAYIFRKIYVTGALALRESEKERILARHGWFAELALSFGKDDSSPERMAVLGPARKTAFVFLGAFFVFGVMALIGLVLFVFAILGYKRGKLKAAYASSHPSLSLSRLPYLETMALFMLVFPVGSIIAGFLPRLFVWLPFGFAMAILYWIRFRGVSRSDMFRDIGWTRGAGIFREMFSGLMGYLAGLPILGVGFMVTLVLVKLTGAQPSHPIMNQFQDAGLVQILGLMFLACVAAPVVEETLFRGVFYHYLRGFGSTLAAALTTGLVFAAIHPQGLATIPVLGAIGVVFALIREWRDSLIASMTAHACNNFLVLCLVTLVL